MLWWFKGVRGHEFIDPKAKVEFPRTVGGRYSGKDSHHRRFECMYHLKFEPWVGVELPNLVEKGCLNKSSDIADVEKQRTPRLILALGMELTKSRL